MRRIPVPQPGVAQSHHKADGQGGGTTRLLLGHNLRLILQLMRSAARPLRLLAFFPGPGSLLLFLLALLYHLWLGRAFGGFLNRGFGGRCFRS